MEAQLQRPSHGHHHNEENPDHQHVGLHSEVVEGEDHHGEKKSVLKKVKDKAKKIKDTIKKHGQGHEHEHEHEGDHKREDNDQEICEEEDEEVDEQVVNDPEVHGAPVYESTVIRSTDLPKEANADLEKLTNSREDRYEHDVRDQGANRPFAPGHGAPAEFERPPAKEADAPREQSTLPTTPQSIDRDKPNAEEPKIKLEPPLGLEKDPHSPSNSPANIAPSNYQSKVADPSGAGGKAADVAPLVRQFDNLNVHDAPVSKPGSEQRPDTGSHDQFTPQSTPPKNQFNPESNPVIEPENTELNPKSREPAKTEDTSQETIAGKISSATSAVTDKAVSAKNVVGSKLGYGGGHQGEGQDSSNKPISESASEYAHKVAETLAPVYEKVASAGGAVMSKAQGGGVAKHEGRDTTAAKGANNGVSMKEYLSEKFRPGDEDRELSEAISNALHKKREAVLGTGNKHQVAKVTESEEVAACLGTVSENKREGEDALASGQESSGQGVVDRLKDAVGLWLGKSTGVQTAQDSVGRSYVSDTASASGAVGQGKEVNVERPSH